MQEWAIEMQKEESQHKVCLGAGHCGGQLGSVPLGTLGDRGELVSELSPPLRAETAGRGCLPSNPVHPRLLHSSHSSPRTQRGKSICRESQVCVVGRCRHGLEN